MPQSNYPHLKIMSKNYLAKRLTTKKLDQTKAIALINDTIKNFDQLWEDHPTESKPKKLKWVRDASRTQLGVLLKAIDLNLLKPNDHLLPDFIFGGVNGLDHKAALKSLLGVRRKRIILKMDITRFYEQIKEDRVFSLFYNHKMFGCSKEVSQLIASLCCVPHGAKDNPDGYKTIARGFPTSSRLSVWCNLEVFLKIERLVKKELKDKDPRIAIYVDDIGITASKASVEEMVALYKKIKIILEEGKHQKLPLNDSKTKIVLHSGDTYNAKGEYEGKWAFEHLGGQMNRNSVVPGSKTRWKISDIAFKVKQAKGKNKALNKKQKALKRYKAYLKRD